jgi:hypothetical protein
MNLNELLREANDVCRSAKAIADRHGTATNWDAFSNRVSKALSNQHKYLSKNICPLCTRLFTTPQGLGLHLKRGRCKLIEK